MNVRFLLFGIFIMTLTTVSSQNKIKWTSWDSVSEKLENKNAIRAVASANGANAISIIVPCHRIVGSDGALVGYAGGLSAKQKLLVLENAKFGQSANQITLEF